MLVHNNTSLYPIKNSMLHNITFTNDHVSKKIFIYFGMSLSLKYVLDNSITPKSIGSIHLDHIDLLKRKCCHNKFCRSYLY